MNTRSTILEKTTPDASSWATNALTVDNNGNLLTYNDGTASSIAYDYENRPTNLVASALTNQYGYDGLGDRTLRTVNGIQHRDVLDRSAELHNMLMITDAAGNPLRYYIWGRGLVAQIETNGTVYYYHPDTRGSTLAMTDANGSTVAEYAYSPYGQIMNHTGVDTHYNWIGTYGVWHEGADMFHMKARYYNAALRRFVTPDPIGLDGGFNLYVYCGNNPLNSIDPL
ncbi:MAG: hypothetical protein EOM12_15535, partial [Verrucomicrobiae bacterium]|nr:hypothetical protein [Verrucomicrobiae bacterium]